MLCLHRFSPRYGPKRVVGETVGETVAVAVVGGVRVMTIPMIIMLWCGTLTHALIRVNVIVIVVILTMEARGGRRRGKAQV